MSRQNPARMVVHLTTPAADVPAVIQIRRTATATPARRGISREVAAADTNKPVRPARNALVAQPPERAINVRNNRPIPTAILAQLAIRPVRAAVVKSKAEQQVKNAPAGQRPELVINVSETSYLQVHREAAAVTPAPENCLVAADLCHIHPEAVVVRQSLRRLTKKNVCAVLK